MCTVEIQHVIWQSNKKTRVSFEIYFIRTGRDHTHIILCEFTWSVFIQPTTAASSWQLSQLLDRMMNGDGWSRLDPTYVTWFDYRLSLLLWGARNKGCRTTACIGVYRNMARPQSKEKKKI